MDAGDPAPARTSRWCFPPSTNVIASWQIWIRYENCGIRLSQNSLCVGGCVGGVCVGADAFGSFSLSLSLSLSLSVFLYVSNDDDGDDDGEVVADDGCACVCVYALCAIAVVMAMV